ncbi:unnamed protein product [Ixodes persulcatus]
MDLASSVRSWLPQLKEEDVEITAMKLKDVGIKCLEHLRYVRESDLEVLAPVERRMLLEKFSEVSTPASSSTAPSGHFGDGLSMASNRRSEWAENFSIPWEMFPPSLLQACKDQQKPTKGDIHQVVRTLSSLIIDQHPSPGRHNLRIIAAKIADKFPSSFQDTLQGTVLGSGIETLMWKLENCVNNKKRSAPQLLPTEIVDDPDSFQPRKRSVRDSYGCVAWQPELPCGETVHTQAEKRQRLLVEYTKLQPDERLVNDLMLQSFPSQRSSINNSSSVGHVKESWPFLFKEECLVQHAKQLLCDEVVRAIEVNMEKVGLRVYRYAYSQLKLLRVKKSLEQTEEAKRRLQCVTPEHESVLLLLLALFNEDEEMVYKIVEETAGDTDLGDMPATPSICIKGPSLFMSSKFTVCMDGIALTTTCNRAVASKLMFLLYFVLNVEYPPEVALTMEFVQRAIAGINPDKSSKARKTSRKQHSLSPKVAVLGNALENYAL